MPLRERRRIARRNEDTALRIAENVGDPAHRRRDHGTAARQRLEHDVRRSLHPARQREEIRRREPACDFAERARTGRHDRAAGARRARIDLRPPHAVAHEDEDGAWTLRTHAIDRVEELPYPFLWLEAPDEEHHLRVSGQPELTPRLSAISPGAKSDVSTPFATR